MLTTPAPCIMMFIQFFIWGGVVRHGPQLSGNDWLWGRGLWLDLLGRSDRRDDQPVLGGHDRRPLPASQIVLGILHLIGTAGMYVATTFMTVENPSLTPSTSCSSASCCSSHRGHRQHRGHEQHC